MQCACHIDSGVIIIYAAKPYKFGSGIRTDQPQEISKINATSLAYSTPAFNTYMPGDLTVLR